MRQQINSILIKAITNIAIMSKLNYSFITFPIINFLL